MGALRRRGKVWWIRYCRHGKRHEESARTTKKSVALALLRNREGRIAAGEPVSAAMGRLTFDVAAQAVITDYKVNGKKSLAVLERRITKHLTPWFGGRRMTDVTPDFVQAYVLHRQVQRASNGSINRELTTLKRAFSLAVRHNKLTTRPCIDLLDEDNVRQGFFEPEQLAAVLAHLPAPIRPVIEFAAITGWRIPSEVLPLTWGQVDLAAGTVRLEVGTTKSGAGRTFAMTAALRTLLEARKTATDAMQRETGRINPLVFYRMVAKGRRGPKAPKRITSFTKAWQAACKAAGCPGRLPHDLRRTAIRTFVRAGISENVAMTMSGHKTRSVFDRYDIVSEGDLFDAATKLDIASGTNMGQSTRPGSGAVPVSA